MWLPNSWVLPDFYIRMTMTAFNLSGNIPVSWQVTNNNISIKLLIDILTFWKFLDFFGLKLQTMLSSSWSAVGDFTSFGKITVFGKGAYIPF